MAGIVVLAGCGGDGVTGDQGIRGRAGSLAGSVTLDGTGAPGATLTLETAPPRSVATAADGSYRMEGIPPGTWTLRLAPPQGGTFSDSARAVTSAPGQEARADFHGTLPRTALLQGTVRADGIAMDGVDLLLSGPEQRTTVTDSSGAFRFESLVRGGYTLRLSGLDPTRWAFPDTVRALEVGTGASLSLDFQGVRVPRPPSRPQGWAAALTPRLVRVGWQPVDEVESYRVERRPPGGSWALLASPTPSDSAFEDPGVEPGGSYAYRVEACNPDGCSGPSEVLEVTTPLTPPPTPTTLTATATGTDRILLRWTPGGTGAAEFRAFRRRDEGGWEPAGSVPADSVALLDRGLEPGTLYRFRVQGCGSGGCSEFSPEASARTLDVPPEAPTALEGVALGPTVVRLTWTDGRGVVTEVRLERRVGTGAWTPLPPRPAGSGWADDSGAVAATLHGYRARGCNEGGCSPWTDAVEVTTPQAPPGAPSALTAVATSGDRVDLGWQLPPGGVDEVRVQRRVGGGPWGALATLPGTAAGHADTQVTAGQLHGYRVQGCNDAGCGPFTSEASATPVVSELNLSVAAVHLNQVVQTLGGGVPLVAGRGGVLRVFVKANMANTARPQVRVRLYHGATQVAVHTLNAPGASVPQTPDLTVFGSSWNVNIPAAQVVPGLSVLVEVDPDGTIPESDRSDNVYPAAGSPLPLEVRTVPPFRVRFVPVHQSSTGLTGSVNAGSLLGDALQLFPLRDADADVRLPYTTALDSLKSDDANNAWTALLSELNVLRVAEGGDRHYYGVVRTTYTSGIAGYGYVGGRTAVGWDRSSASWVAAHEWGHNFGRRHAPCGVSNPDGSYPYAGGIIGVPGWNGSSLVAAGTRDLMGYCSPRWISDYTFKAVMDHRGSAGAWGGPVAAGTGAAGAGPTGATHGAWAAGPGSSGAPTTEWVGGPAAGAAPVPVLVLWGRIDARGSGAVLEPAFQVTAPPSLPEAPGPSVVEGLDASGAVLFSLPFEGTLTGEEDGRHFAFALPLSSFPAERLATLRLREGGQTLAVRSGAPGASPAPGVPGAPGEVPLRAERRGASGVVVRWDAERVPLLVIRDAESGQILSLGRGGTVVLPEARGELEVTSSDGIRSRTGRLRP